MVLLPVVSFTLLSVGPAVRVVYYGYLPVEELAIALGSSVLGASLALDGVRRLRGIAPGALWRRWQLLQWIGAGLLVAWIAFAHLFAFPASGDAAEHAAWARSRIPMYSALALVVNASHRSACRSPVRSPPNMRDTHVITCRSSRPRFLRPSFGE